MKIDTSKLDELLSEPQTKKLIQKITIAAREYLATKDREKLQKQVETAIRNHRPVVDTWINMERKSYGNRTRKSL